VTNTSPLSPPKNQGEVFPSPTRGVAEAEASVQHSGSPPAFGRQFFSFSCSRIEETANRLNDAIG